MEVTLSEDKSPKSDSETSRRRRRNRRPAADSKSPELIADPEAGAEKSSAPTAGVSSASARRKRRRRRGGRGRGGGENQKSNPAGVDELSPDTRVKPTGRHKTKGDYSRNSAASGASPQQEVEVSGLLELRKGGTGFLLPLDSIMAESKTDVMVPPQMVRKFNLKMGSIITGKASGPGGKLRFVDTVDGLPANESRRCINFNKLRAIDPDFHYELGSFEQEGQISMRIIDLLAPIGRGQRALLVAPPRSGKTMLMQQIARGMEALYPDVHLIVLLIDERPEEATYWCREIKNGEVFVSTMDKTSKEHVRLTGLVQARAERLVESGREVVILLDSITRMARAFNHETSSNGKTMSGGLDSRAMAKPKKFFGNARNTEEAGSLTILGTCLVETGSRMDQVIFEEFKGTGNSELVLDRRLADRRIFPAIAIDRSGTRKEEKLRTKMTQKKVDILRRVLSRMRPLEAMELMVNRLAQFPSNREFLGAFSMDDVE